MRTLVAATGAALFIAIASNLSTSTAGEPSDSSNQAIISGQARAKDGDSVLIGEGKGTVDVRLHGIDAPEWDQECRDKQGAPWPCGGKAKAELAKLVDGKQLRCEVTDVEKTGGKRPIVRCFDGTTNISEAIVSSGAVWVFDRYARQFEDYSALKAIEAKAKAKGVGLWQGNGEPEPPWEFRKQRWARYAARAPNGCPIIAKRTSEVYRTPWSPRYAQMFKEAVAGAGDWLWFCTDREAVAAGYRSARR